MAKKQKPLQKSQRQPPATPMRVPHVKNPVRQRRPIRQPGR